MNQLNRRELLQSAGFLLTTSQLRGASPPAAAPGSAYDWIRSTRILIAEAYNPPFYPSFDYEAEKAVKHRARTERRFATLPGGILLRLLPHEIRLPGASGAEGRPHARRPSISADKPA